mmetsp:Transcript_87536/g.282873  ORF Transcript_87536/g.282873 Transcript_87536/m.282873 type:complete len:203 (+) Transcript_87536:532-1140(+)
MVPIIPPLAARPQYLRQPRAALLLVAPAVFVRTIEVLLAEAVELCCASRVEDSLAGTRDLDVKAVLASNVLANVRDLHDHGLADQVRVRAPPVPVWVDLVRELQLVALAAILVACQAAVAAHGSGSKTHAQPPLDYERLVVGATRGASAIARGLHIGVEQLRSCVDVAREHRLVDTPLAGPGAARLAAVPIPSCPRPVDPLL